MSSWTRTHWLWAVSLKCPSVPWKILSFSIYVSIDGNLESTKSRVEWMWGTKWVWTGAETNLYKALWFLEKSLEFTWESIYKEWHNLIYVLILSLHLLYGEYTEQSRIKEHSTSSLVWPWGCHLLSQFQIFFFFEIIKDNSILSLGVHHKCLMKGSWMMSVSALRVITHKWEIVIPAADTTHSSLTTISHRSVCEQGLINFPEGER